MTEGLEKYKLFLKRRVIFYKNTIANIKEKQGPNPSSRLNYHGGWQLGYFEGLLAQAENNLDKLEAELNGKSTQIGNIPD